MTPAKGLVLIKLHSNSTQKRICVTLNSQQNASRMIKFMTKFTALIFYASPILFIPDSLRMT